MITTSIIWYSMRRVLGSIFGLTLFGKAVVASACLHIALVAVLALGHVRSPQEEARFRGTRQVIHLQMLMSEPQPLTFEIPAEEEPVVIMPSSARIAKRTYVETLASAVPLERMIEPEAEPELAEKRQPELPPLAAPTRMDSPTPRVPAPEPPQLARTPTAVPPAPPTTVASKPEVLGTDDSEPPDFSGNRPPRYPELARQRRWEGTVLLRLWIAADGSVSHVELAQSSGHAVLDAEAVRTVRTWKGQAARRGGVPVASEELLPVRFRIP